MAKLAGGNLQASVAGAERKDEIGGMARAVQVFKDAGLEKQRVEAEAEAQRAASEQERQRVEAERAAAAQQQEFVVHSVKEIKALISASTQQVDVGVKLVSETGQALGRIVTQAQKSGGPSPGNGGYQGRRRE